MSQWSPLAAVGAAMMSVGVQGLQIAIRAKFVREVLGPRAWIALPGTRDEVPGVVVWGGRAIALLDVAQFQPGLRRLAPGEIRPRTLLVETRAGRSVTSSSLTRRSSTVARCSRYSTPNSS